MLAVRHSSNQLQISSAMQDQGIGFALYFSCMLCSGAVDAQML
jgi:hypothetical protein